MHIFVDICSYLFIDQLHASVEMKFENLLGQHGTAVAKRLGWKQGLLVFSSNLFLFYSDSFGKK